MSENKVVGQWTYRRILIFAIVAFCMGLLTWLTWYGNQEGALHQLIAEGCMWMIVAVLLFYCVGASFDDLQFLKHLPVIGSKIPDTNVEKGKT